MRNRFSGRCPCLPRENTSKPDTTIPDATLGVNVAAELEFSEEEGGLTGRSGARRRDVIPQASPPSYPPVPPRSILGTRTEYPRFVKLRRTERGQKLVRKPRQRTLPQYVTNGGRRTERQKTQNEDTWNTERSYVT